MKSLIVCILGLILSALPAKAQEIDKELTTLAEKLAEPIKAHSTKKITVLDFTDLHGSGSELGKYIAEQLTVEFVIGKNSFAVLDRANLAKILAEHKLTASGLVDPENAKKLGMFAGVDALILGTIVPMNQSIQLTAKVITTDTAEIVGAARVSFKTNENVQQLLSRVTEDRKEESNSGNAKPEKPKISKSFGDLTISFERVTGAQDGSLLLYLIFENKSKSKSIAVAMHGEPNYYSPVPLRSSLIGTDGTECKSNEDSVTGIHSLVSRPDQLTEIKPGEEIRPAIKYRPNQQWAQNVSSLRLQAEIVINPDYRENQYADYRPEKDVLPPRCVIQNLVFDIPVGKGK